jgi:Raf kinase inhibitor-like YbhB/YbcL family protein
VKTGLLILLPAAAVFFTLAFKAAPLPAKGQEGSAFQLSSENFGNNGIMPAELARRKVEGGKNISPALQWSNPPAETKSFALLCLDLHPVAGRWIHWMAVNLPADAGFIPPGASPRQMPENSRELLNSFGEVGWGGPQPPKGTGIHQYVFTLYALNVDKISADISSEKEFLAAIRGKVLDKARLTGFFKQ